MGTAFLYNEPEYGLYADLNRDCILDQRIYASLNGVFFTTF